MGIKQQWHVKNVTFLHLADGLATEILKQVSSSHYYCQRIFKPSVRPHEWIKQLEETYRGPFGSNLGDCIHSLSIRIINFWYCIHRI